MGMTKQEQEATILAVSELRQRVQALENQVRDLQALVLNLKMYPPTQYIPAPQLPQPPQPYYPPFLPYSPTHYPVIITCAHTNGDDTDTKNRIT